MLAEKMATHRSPAQATKWEKQVLKQEPSSSTKPPQKAASSSKKPNGHQVSTSAHSKPPVEEDNEEEIDSDEALDDFKNLTQSSKPKPFISSPGLRKTSSPLTTAPAPVKRSLFDAQPDARRISFDSQSRTATPLSFQPSSSRKRVASQELPSPSKKVRPPPAEDPESDEDWANEPPPPNQERLKRPAPPANKPKPAAAAPRPSADEILDRIHGEQAAPVRPVLQGKRKGRGIAWTEEQEDFFVDLVTQYGAAWSDIWHRHCQPGGMLEGRDQIMLKDKARNIKEKMIRYGSLSKAVADLGLEMDRIFRRLLLVSHR